MDYGYGGPMKSFFIPNPNSFGFCRRFGQRYFEAFGFFSANLSAPILVQWVSPLSMFSINQPISLQKDKLLCPNRKYLFGIGIGAVKRLQIQPLCVRSLYYIALQQHTTLSCYKEVRGHSTTTWTEFCHFLPRRGQFLYLEHGQKQHFWPPHLVHVGKGQLCRWNPKYFRQFLFPFLFFVRLNSILKLWTKLHNVYVFYKARVFLPSFLC